MQALDTSTPSHLKLAPHTSNTNEFSAAPAYADLEISAAEAQALIDLIGLAQQFRRQHEERGLIETCYDISFGLGRSIPMFRVIELPFTEEAEPDSSNAIVMLPEDFDPNESTECSEYRVECHRVEVGHDSVRFSALAKHGDDRFSTTSLSEELLQKIANDHPIDLPPARLTSRNAGS